MSGGQTMNRAFEATRELQSLVSDCEDAIRDGNSDDLMNAVFVVFDIASELRDYAESIPEVNP